MLIEAVDVATQARFVETYPITTDVTDQLRLDASHLFLAYRYNSGNNVMRAYHRIGEDGAGENVFEVRAAAGYTQPDEIIPALTRVDLGQTGRFELMAPNNAQNRVSIVGWLQGFTFRAGYFRASDKLDYFGFEKDGKRISTTIINRIPESKASPDGYLRSQGIIRDREAGIIQLTMGGMTATVKERLDLEAVLDAFFPQGLRDDPYGARAEMDGWAQVNWLEVFGMTFVQSASGSVLETPQSVNA